jgi:hypothetical protein
MIFMNADGDDPKERIAPDSEGSAAMPVAACFGDGGGKY